MPVFVSIIKWAAIVLFIVVMLAGALLCLGAMANDPRDPNN